MFGAHPDAKWKRIMGLLDNPITKRRSHKNSVWRLNFLNDLNGLNVWNEWNQWNGCGVDVARGQLERLERASV